MKALQFRRNLPRYAAARIVGGVVPGRGASAGPLSLVDMDPPTPPVSELVSRGSRAACAPSTGPPFARPPAARPGPAWRT